MSQENKETITVLVKALPQPSEKYSETVCVAGVTAKSEWRRLYPVKFRNLDDQFKRWHWIEYQWHKPRDDRRTESRNVDGESIRITGTLKSAERIGLLKSLIRPSVEEATRLGESLTIVRPTDVRFSWEEKTPGEIAAEREAFANAARQTSFFDEELKALSPCPLKFFFDYKTSDGKPHHNFCHDWETSAAFHNLSMRYDSDRALGHLSNEFNVRYPQEGMAFVMGTHSQRPYQWLLIGVLRLDNDAQGSLAF